MIFPLPITTTIGNPDAMANTNPDAIKAYNGLVLDDCEPYSPQGETFIDLPLDPILGIQRSFESCDRRPVFSGASSKSDAYKRSGTYSRGLGDPSSSIINRSAYTTHPLWSNNSINDCMTYEFYLRRKSAADYIPLYIFFLGSNYDNTERLPNNCYYFQIWGTPNWSQFLGKRVNAINTTLDIVTNSAIPMYSSSNVFHKIVFKIYPKTINIYINNILRLTSNDTTLRNGTFFGHLFSYGSSKIRFNLDDLKIY